MKKQLLTLFLVILLVCSMFTACGDDATLQAVIIKDQPTKTEYVIGETFDFTGATLEITLSDGTVKKLDVTADMLSGNLEFTKAGKAAITVIYTEAGVTKQAVIYVNVVDPTPVINTLTEAKENAKAELKAFYDTLILVTPAGQNAAGEPYPALTVDLATPAKAVYDTAVEAIDNGSDIAAVYALKAEAVAELGAMDTYIDFYAAVKAAQIRTDFDLEYVPDRLFWINYAELRYNMEILAAKIMRADSLDQVDALVETEDEIYENAENTVDELAALIVSFKKWQMDLPLDPAGDATDEDCVLAEDLAERIAILFDEDLTDEFYAKTFVQRINKYPVASLSALTISDEFLDMVAGYINTEAGTVNLLDFDFDTMTLADSVYGTVDTVYNNLLDARTEADAQDGLEDIVLAAVAAADEEAKQGIIYDPTNESSVHNQVLEAKELFDLWVETYGVAERNYDLVEGYDKLLAYAAQYEAIEEAIVADPQCTLPTVPTVIILNDTVKGEIEAAEAVANAWATPLGIPANARYVNDSGEVVYVIPGYETLYTARTRYDQLVAAKEAANAVATEETVNGPATDINLLIVNKTVVFANQTATENAVASKTVIDIQAAYDALIAEYQINTFAFDGVNVDEQTTIDANMKAIFGEANITALADASARVAVLQKAYDDARVAETGLIAKIDAILAQALVLDRADDRAAAEEAFEAWCTAFELDPEDAFDDESIHNLLTDEIGDKYTAYLNGSDNYDDVKAMLDELIADLKALKAPANIIASDRATVEELRAAFNALAVANGDTSTSKAGTAAHVTWEAADTSVVDGYDKLCRAEATLFAIDYVALVTGADGYTAQINALRDAYLVAIGSTSGRGDDALAINQMGAEATAYISNTGAFLSDHGFDNETVVGRLKAGETYAAILANANDALAAFVADGGEADYSFCVAARYLVTVDNGVYTLKVYAGGVYTASTILTADGLTPAEYALIEVHAAFADVVLDGFTAQNIVYYGVPASFLEQIPEDMLPQLPVPSLVLSNVTVNKVTTEAPVILVIEATSKVTSIVTKKEAGIDYDGTDDLAITASDSIEIQAPNAKVQLVSTIVKEMYVGIAAKHVEAVIGYEQSAEALLEEGIDVTTDLYVEITTTDSATSTLSVFLPVGTPTDNIANLNVGEGANITLVEGVIDTLPEGDQWTPEWIDPVPTV